MMTRTNFENSGMRLWLRRLYFALVVISFVLWFSHPGWVYFALQRGLYIPVPVVFVTSSGLLIVARFFLVILDVLPLTRGVIFLYGTLLLISLRVLIGFYLGELQDIPEDLVASTVAQAIVYAWFLSLLGEGSAMLVVMQRLYFQRWLFFVFVLLLLALLYGVTRSAVDGRGLYLDFFVDDSQEIFNYHSIGDSLAVVAILLFGRSLAIGLLASLLLALSYSRTSLVGYLAALVLTGRWRGISLRILLRNQVILVLLSSLAVLGGVLLWDSVGEIVFIERIASLLTGDDASLRERLNLFREFGNLVLSYGLLGAFLYEVRDGGPGTYIHSILSYWLEYGIIPFMGVVLTVALGFVAALKDHKKGRSIALTLMVFVVVSAVFSRSYVWPYLWYGLGFSLAWSAGGNER